MIFIFDVLPSSDRGVHGAVLLDPALGGPPLQLLPRVHAAAGAPPLPQPGVQVQQRQEGRHRLLALPNTHRWVRRPPGDGRKCTLSFR